MVPTPAQRKESWHNSPERKVDSKYGLSKTSRPADEHGTTVRHGHDGIASSTDGNVPTNSAAANGHGHGRNGYATANDATAHDATALRTKPDVQSIRDGHAIASSAHDATTNDGAGTADDAAADDGTTTANDGTVTAHDGTGTAIDDARSANARPANASSRWLPTAQQSTAEHVSNERQLAAIPRIRVLINNSNNANEKLKNSKGK